MTAFIIVTIILFLLSLSSNIVYVLSGEAPNKLGSVSGIIIFSSMIAWATFLLLG